MNLKKITILLFILILLNSCITISALNNTYYPSINSEIRALVPGVKISQVDFTFIESTEINSDWGRIEFDINDLISFFGIEEGFVNIYTDTGWVIQNLFVNKIEGIKSLTTYFNLGKEFEGINLQNT